METDTEKIRGVIKECPVDECLGAVGDCYTCQLAQGLLAALDYIEFMHHNEREIVEADIAKAMGLNRLRKV